MTELDKATRTELEAGAFRALMDHLLVMLLYTYLFM